MKLTNIAKMSAVLGALALPMAWAGSTVTGLHFEPDTKNSILVIEYDGSQAPIVREDARMRQVLIEIPGAQLPSELTRAMDFAAHESPVVQITPYNTAGTIPGAKIVMQLREQVKLSKENAAGKLTLRLRPLGASAPEARSAFENVIPPAPRRIELTKAWIESDSIRETFSATDKTDRSSEIAHQLEETLNAGTEARDYHGAKVNFEAHDADVHDIFKLVSATSGLNIISATDVTGKVNLSLTGVPWDQVLDVVLQQLQLRIAVSGNIVRVMTLAAYNRELDERKRSIELTQALEPTIMAIIPVSFAKVDDMKKMIDTLLVKSASSPTQAAAGSSAIGPGADKATTQQAFERGKIETDQRSNSLVVTNTAAAIDRIRKLVKELDVPMPQVLIESKIVVASESFSRALGVSWAAAQAVGSGGRAGGGLSFNGQSVSSAASGGTGASALASTFAVASGSANAAAGFTLGAGSKANINVQLSLGENNNVAKTIASPKIIVNNKQSATINDTLQAAYKTQSTSQGGVATETKFVSVPVTLNVTPQITNAGSVLMDLAVTKTSLDDASTGQTTSKSLNTQVLVDSGSTLVLGGVYQYQTNSTSNGIPYLKDLPVLGFLFRNKTDLEAKSELLVFVTPKILETGPSGISDR